MGTRLVLSWISRLHSSLMTKPCRCSAGQHTQNVTCTAVQKVNAEQADGHHMRTSRVQQLRCSPSLHGDNGRRRGSCQPHRCGGRCRGCQTASGSETLQLMRGSGAAVQLACRCKSYAVAMQPSCVPATHHLGSKQSAHKPACQPAEVRLQENLGTLWSSQQSCALCVCGLSSQAKSARSRP